MSRARVIRVGDWVRIVNPVFVERVGYPLVWTCDEIQEEVLRLPVALAMATLGLDFSHRRERRERRDFEVGVAKALVRHRGFGGRERTLHRTEPVEHERGSTFEVSAVKTVVTGTYSEDWVSEGYEYQPYDYLVRFLDNQQRHRLLRDGVGQWIERTNVDVIQDPGNPGRAGR